MTLDAATRKTTVPNYISFKACDELYHLIAKEADRNGKAMIDVVVQAVAEKLGRPDLGYVPRKSQVGRPRSKKVPA